MAQATYDTFITEERLNMQELADTLWKTFLLREAWSKESNFMGYIAVATDDGKASLGRRDIVINWRNFAEDGHPKYLGMEVCFLCFKPLVHHGFYNVYTSASSTRSQFNLTSARDQVIEEVKRLVEEYKNEEVSITVTGHSLGASLATLNAVDIAFNGINKTSEGKEFPVTAFPFASPKVGDLQFKAAFDKLKAFISYVKPPGDPASWHLLEPYLHGVAGTQGLGLLAGFKLEVNRDISLVNKQWDVLKDEYCIPGFWWVEKNKGMAQQEDGSWLMLDRDDDFDGLCGIDILDTIVIDDNDFVDEDSNSASLFELAKQLDLQELNGGDLNNGPVADFTVDLNGLDTAAKDFHSSINVMPSLEVVPPRKSSCNDVIPSLEVAPPRKSRSRPLRLMWATLCGWITQFSLGSSDDFTELESSIASTLEEIKKVNIIDVSSLEDHVENFSKS
ncbi:hypothetical protein H5410_007649 [Solanum commersonii]|uniref:Phospholipase A1 n=1 Tax=Solanum commersonii TaxID=4109 RepID=A0A9J6AEP6_SOLCO|nr:hypothetical protein H5410_007649 [Solanum commersonii]